jgi:uncharacterized hydrophobic protein (TIGR00271 family)
MSKTIGKIVNDTSKFIVKFFTVSELRKEAIYSEIVYGSDPRFNYYLLLLLSALIATFGLIANSPAVVIGAMLVSPLMMPIFGISLSLIAGDSTLFRSAMLAEIGGIILVVGSSFLVGISPFSFEMTLEILNRTSPNLLDLFVASLAGFAGCLAMIDERVSPILPGIAISTSLTPPLAACGLCFAFGAFDGGMGAFILFMANFLTILFVASITFMISGFIKGRFMEHKTVLAKRFALAAISMIAIVFFLSNAMIRLVEEKTAVSTIKKAMLAKLSDVQNLEIKEITLDRTAGGKELNALIVIDAPREPTPYHLQAIEADILQKLNKPVNIFVQTRITKSVSSSREKLMHFYRSADGINEVHRPGKDVQILNVATQFVRERLEEIPSMQVSDIDLRYAADGGKIIYTTIQGPLRPFPGGIREIELKIQQTLNDPNIRLVARYIESYEITSDGINVFDLTRKNVNSKEKQLRDMAKEQIRKLSSLYPQAVNAGLIKGRWIVVAEVNGATVMTPKQADAIQSKLRKFMKKDVLFMAFSRAEAMVGGKGTKKEFNNRLNLQSKPSK